MTLQNRKIKCVVTDEEGRKLIEKMMTACIKFAEGKSTLNQLWYHFRGERRNRAIQQCIKDDQLGYLLFQLYMDFLSWKDERNDIIRRSATEVAEQVLRYQQISAKH